MACTLQFSLFLSLVSLVSCSVSHNPILPKAAVLPVRKDPSTLQYVANVFMGETLAPVKLVLDLNGAFVWVDCGSGSAFSSLQPIKSCSLKCSMAKPIKGCYRPATGAEHNSKTCTSQAENAVSRMSTSGDLSEDRMAMEFWDGTGSAAGSFAKSEKFLFSCASNLLLKGLADGAKGMLGLGNSRISLPSQFSTKFGFFQRKFSLCLSASDGAIFLGGNPYESEISNSVMYTPLILGKNGGYYIDVSSIKISGKKLSLHQKWSLRTKISTVVPYTTMEGNIYGTFVEAYVKAATSMNLTLVQSVAPFEFCFSSNEGFGANVPSIDVVLQSEMVGWRINGRNSMVHVSDDVMCLGFLNGGLGSRDSIVIGGYQIENNVLEFNLGSSMLGFSSLVGNKCSGIEASSSRVVF